MTSVPGIESMSADDVFSILRTNYEYHFLKYRVPLVFNIDIELFLQYSQTAGIAEGIAQFLTYIAGIMQTLLVAILCYIVYIIF